MQLQAVTYYIYLLEQKNTFVVKAFCIFYMRLKLNPRLKDVKHGCSHNDNTLWLVHKSLNLGVFAVTIFSLLISDSH